MSYTVFLHKNATQLQLNKENLTPATIPQLKSTHIKQITIYGLQKLLLCLTLQDSSECCMADELRPNDTYLKGSLVKPHEEVKIHRIANPFDCVNPICKS